VHSASTTSVPVLLEPVINVDLEVKVLTEVTGPCRSHEEVLAFWDGVGTRHLFVRALVVLTENAKALELL